MDIPAVDLGRKVDPGELAEWDLAEWRHLSPQPTHPFTHAKTQTHTPSSCSGLGEERERERDSDRRTEADEWGEREREREQCVPGTPRSPNTTTVSPRSIQWRSNEHNRDRPKPENILYTPHVRVFFTPISPPPPNHRWRTCQGKTRNKNEQTGEERRRKERKKKKDLRTDFFPPRYFPRDSPAI